LSGVFLCLDHAIWEEPATVPLSSAQRKTPACRGFFLLMRENQL
jgi:hypothetical protein